MWDQAQTVVDVLEGRLPPAAAHREYVFDKILAFTTVPQTAWQQIWSDNPCTRLNKEIRRRTDAVGVCLDRNSVTRLIGAVIAENTTSGSTNADTTG